MKKPREIVDDILYEVKKYWNNKQKQWEEGEKEFIPDGSEKPWTIEIIEIFTRVGNKLGYVTRSKGQSGGEYLLDIVIVERPKAESWRTQKDIIVAVECEWSKYRDEVHYDFMKLCDIKADLRVMVYSDLKDDVQDKELIPFLNNLTNERRHKHNDDAYLAIGIPETGRPKESNPKAYYWEADGQQPKPIPFDDWKN